MKNEEINIKGIIIYAHPYDGSYSNAMKLAAEKGFEDAEDKSCQVIDLFVNKYNSIGDIENKPTFVKQITKYKNMLNKVNQMVIVFPVWWSGMPAIMQSFFNNVSPYSSKEFENLSKVYIYTTSATPNTIIKTILKSPVKHQLKSLAKKMGATNIIYRNLDKISCSQERRENFLKKITKEVKNG